MGIKYLNLSSFGQFCSTFPLCASVVLGFVFPYQTKRLTWETSPKWPVLCWVGHKTLTSDSPSDDLGKHRPVLNDPFTVELESGPQMKWNQTYSVFSVPLWHGIISTSSTIIVELHFKLVHSMPCLTGQLVCRLQVCHFCAVFASKFSFSFLCLPFSFLHHEVNSC